MKKVQFNYEYFKKHPETKLETRDREEVRFISKASICKKKDNELIFETEKYIITTTIDGLLIDNKSEYGLDIFMLVESKETVVYANVREDGITYDYNSLDNAIKYSGKDAKSVAKLTIVDSEIVKTETVHKY